MSYYGYSPENFQSDFGFIGDAINYMGKWGNMAYDASQIQQQMRADESKIKEFQGQMTGISDAISSNKRVQNAWAKSKGIAVGKDGEIKSPDNLAKLGVEAGILSSLPGGGYRFTQANEDGSVKMFSVNDSSALLGSLLKKDYDSLLADPNRYVTKDGKKIHSVRDPFEQYDETVFNFANFSRKLMEQDPNIYPVIEQIYSLGNGDEKVLAMDEQGRMKYQKHKQITAFDNMDWSSEIDNAIGYDVQMDSQGNIQSSKAQKIKKPTLPSDRQAYTVKNGLSGIDEIKGRNKLMDDEYTSQIVPIMKDQAESLMIKKMTEIRTAVKPEAGGVSSDYWGTDATEEGMLLSFENAETMLSQNGFSKDLEWLRANKPEVYKQIKDDWNKDKENMLSFLKDKEKKKDWTWEMFKAERGDEQKLSNSYKKILGSLNGMMNMSQEKIDSYNSTIKSDDASKEDKAQAKNMLAIENKNIKRIRDEFELMSNNYKTAVYREETQGNKALWGKDEKTSMQTVIGQAKEAVGRSDILATKEFAKKPEEAGRVVAEAYPYQAQAKSRILEDPETGVKTSTVETIQGGKKAVDIVGEEKFKQKVNEKIVEQVEDFRRKNTVNIPLTKAQKEEQDKSKTGKITLARNKADVQKVANNALGDIVNSAFAAMYESGFFGEDPQDFQISYHKREANSDTKNKAIRDGAKNVLQMTSLLDDISKEYGRKYGDNVERAIKSISIDDMLKYYDSNPTDIKKYVQKYATGRVGEKNKGYKSSLDLK